jgi:hypothetical protein
MERAEVLVPAAHAFAVDSFIPMSKKVSILCHVDPGDWDFFVTVAGIFIAVTRLRNLRLGNSIEDKIGDIVYKKSEEWDKNSPRAFEDCKALFKSTYDTLKGTHEYAKNPQFLASDSLGSWVAANTLRRQVQDERDFTLVRVAGASITHSFYSWWD